MKSVPAKQASKMLQLFLRRDVVLTANTTKKFKKTVHGDMSRFTTDIDISEAVISLVR